ncbi:DnaD domain-containing protein [Halobacillus sp. A5]|uniref:DnaD domain-containing protein n=1 Tax=Halobacillus sp. A5 TaxID=2880263 RepID=UPI0020A64D68|nr:DnaD domain protein [Halobacillus sp. A5]MCP3027043.1 DnaD domain protein [Halobacillus sp. A5]
MNYLKELNAFNDQVDMDSLSPSAITLWFTLMQLNNKTGWKKEFTLPASVVLGKSNLPETSFKRARKELKEKGYIMYTSLGRNQAPVYEMISRVIEPHVNEEAAPHADVPTDHSMDEPAVPLFKRNEMKRKETDEEGASPSNPHEFYQCNIGILSPFIAERITHWCEELSDELVIEALQRALQHNKRFFQYSEAILNRWQSLGVKSLQEARSEKVESRSRVRQKADQGQSKEEFDDIFEELRRERNV